MDWEQSQYLRDCVHQAIADGMRDGFEAMEKQPPVTVTSLIDLRDFFAGCAMVGLFAHGATEHIKDGNRSRPMNRQELAYRAADDMLRARETKQDPPVG